MTTLLYRVSQAPYRKILAVVRDWTEKQKQETIEVALSKRGPYDELIKEFRSGYAFTFDVLDGHRRLARHASAPPLPTDPTELYDRARV